MPTEHSHNDRGTLHPDCSACEVLRKMLSDIGIDPSQIHDLRPNVPDPSFSEGRIHLNTDDLRLLNRPLNVVSDIEAPIPYLPSYVQPLTPVDMDVTYRSAWLRELITLIDNKHLGYGIQCLHAHLYLEHEQHTAPLNLTLRQLQEVHSADHFMGTGHTDAADHFIAQLPIDALRRADRLHAQAQQSQLNRKMKAITNARRTQAARAQRASVRQESVRALKRAIEHTDGTVANRTKLDDCGEVSVLVGFDRPLTLAKVTYRYGARDYTGIGTALCRPGDRFAARVGEALSIGRALRALGHQLEALGHHIDEGLSQ